VTLTSPGGREPDLFGGRDPDHGVIECAAPEFQMFVHKLEHGGMRSDRRRCVVQAVDVIEAGAYRIHWRVDASRPSGQDARPPTSAPNK